MCAETDSFRERLAQKQRDKIAGEVANGAEAAVNERIGRSRRVFDQQPVFARTEKEIGRDVVLAVGFIFVRHVLHYTTNNSKAGNFGEGKCAEPVVMARP